MNIKYLKLIFTTLLILLSSFAVNANDIEARLEELEMRNYTRYFTINGNLYNIYESYNTEYDLDNSNSEKDKYSINTVLTALNLNLNFDVSKNLQIYTRLGMSKFWNHDEGGADGSGQSESSTTWDSSNTGSYAASGSTPKFDRAYMNYSFDMLPLTFAIGRLPTTSGPPEHKSSNEERRGTYPRFAYNTIFDGVALSMDFSKWLPANHKMNLRIFWSEFVNLDQYDRTKKRVVTDGTNYTGKEISFPSITPQYTALFEYNLKNTKLAKSIDLMLFYYKYDRFHQFVQAEKGTTNAADDYVVIYEAEAQMYYLGLDSILGSGFSFNISMLDMDQKDTYLDGSGGNYNSLAFLFNTTYTLNQNLIKGLTLGLEYIKTDKYFYIDDFNNYYLTKFYSTPSNKGFHYSIHKQLDQNNSIKVGFFKMEKDYNDYSGTEESKTNTIYTALNTKF